MIPHVGGPNFEAGWDLPNPVCLMKVNVAKGEPDGVGETAAEPKPVGVDNDTLSKWHTRVLKDQPSCSCHPVYKGSI